MNQLPNATLLAEIANHFQTNRGVIAHEYLSEEARERDLAALETYCAMPGVWYEEDCWEDGYPPNEYNVHMFFLNDFDKLEEHGYADEDGVKVIIYEDGNRILELFVECH